MSSHSIPILYLNMGGEMLYVLRQRLKAQRIDVDKTIQGGGDGFHMLEDLEVTSLGVTTADVLEQYIKKHSPIYTGVEWRISYAGDKENDKCSEENKCGNHGTLYQSTDMMIILPIVSWLLAR